MGLHTAPVYQTNSQNIDWTEIIEDIFVRYIEVNTQVIQPGDLHPTNIRTRLERIKSKCSTEI